ncbi:YkuS family protein [Alicyclobacillus shizuokensis]|uniref:YkuS family protein n=1 Tax=Alicyclobacillus shizuokensis TaxID=392014 RepID=UPI000833CB5D|nr:YkuS family protein [Alicyclobacillus shizuokensis]MCL6627132.1 YkuS family protein [Alicyclobacillus shizuokensis]
MKAVAVEQGLGNVKRYLEAQGCPVVDLENAAESTPAGASVMVVTGGDNNLMGMQDIVADVPIVSAEGLSPEQVYQRVKGYLQ